MQIELISDIFHEITIPKKQTLCYNDSKGENIMKLKTNIDYTAFLFKVRECQGNVSFCTDAGDCLNLKSMLSEYIFLSAAISTALAAHGQLICDEPQDAALLADFMEEMQ